MDGLTRPAARAGRIYRVNGPLVTATGIPDVAMYEVVELGEQRVPAEVVAIDDETLTLQAFEYTGGLMADR